jgi:hypothetical protein
MNTVGQGRTMTFCCLREFSSGKRGLPWRTSRACGFSKANFVALQIGQSEMEGSSMSESAVGAIFSESTRYRPRRVSFGLIGKRVI